MSSFLGTGGTAGFNVELIKPTSTSSGCSSSILTKSASVSSLVISTKRARTPRKRPNQSYMEAATLLSTACPSVFPIKNLRKKHSCSHSSLSSSSSDVITPFPVINEADFLIEKPCPDPNPPFHFKLKPVRTVERSFAAKQHASPPKSPDYDVELIFGDESGEGIDSIMGKLSIDSDMNVDVNPNINPVGLGIGGNFALGLGFGQVGNIRQAMRRTECEDSWKLIPLVEMKDIVPRFNALPPLGKKTKKKTNKVEEEVKNVSKVIKTTISAPCAATSNTGKDIKSGLGLKLNHEEVMKAWGDKGFPFSSEFGTSESSEDIASWLAEIDLAADNDGGGTREASVLKYREKRRTRLFSKKIRYQVRKVNADCKPRMKGRFVKTSSFLQGAIEEESH